MQASESGRKDIVSLLLSAGSNMNAVDEVSMLYYVYIWSMSQYVYILWYDSYELIPLSIIYSLINIRMVAMHLCLLLLKVT